MQKKNAPENGQRLDTSVQPVTKLPSGEDHERRGRGTFTSRAPLSSSEPMESNRAPGSFRGGQPIKAGEVLVGEAYVDYVRTSNLISYFATKRDKLPLVMAAMEVRGIRSLIGKSRRKGARSKGTEHAVLEWDCRGECASRELQTERGSREKGHQRGRFGAQYIQVGASKADYGKSTS